MEKNHNPFSVNIPLAHPAGYSAREICTRRLFVSMFKFMVITYLLAISGNILIVAATTSTIIRLTWDGIQFPWGSAHVLVPVILGMLGLVGFLVYEGRYAKYPMTSYPL